MTAVNDNSPVADFDLDLVTPLGDARLESLVTAAVLVSTAFRLRDEEALILTLRRLTEAVDALQREAEATTPDERRAAFG